MIRTRLQGNKDERWVVSSDALELIKLLVKEGVYGKSNKNKNAG